MKDFVVLGPSPLSSQNSEPPTTAQYHHSMDSGSPSSSGKMMPSGGKGGKGGKPSSMSGLVRTNLSQQLPLQQQQQQHPAYYNGGKGNPTGGNGGYPMMMTHPQQATQQWIPPQQQQQQQQPQQIRYAAHGGKPMNYGQQRMPYPGDPYLMRQQTPQVPSTSSSPYPYASNIGKLIKKTKFSNNSSFYFSSTRLYTFSTDGYECIKYGTNWKTDVLSTTNTADT
jgi:hypothetical protein